MTDRQRPRVLFDTSILFGKWQRRAVTAILDTDRPPIIALWSEWVLAELYYGLAWQWAERSVRDHGALTGPDRTRMADSARLMLTLMLPMFETVPLGPAVPFEAPDFIPDPWDRHLLAAAREGHADIVVLEDGALLRANRLSEGWGEIELMTFAQFQERFDPSVDESPEPDETPA